MANLTISAASMLTHVDPCHKGGDFLLLFAILDRADKILFENRGGTIFPVVETQSSTKEMTELPRFTAGRWLNYYRDACGMRHPEKEGKFSVEIIGQKAEFHFEIASAGSTAFATLTRLKSTVRRHDCKEILDQYGRLTTPIFRRLCKSVKWKIRRMLGGS